MKNNPLILSASTAFFTTFSISPILIILSDLISPLLGKGNVHEELFSKIQDALGHHTAKDVHTIVDGFEAQESSLLLTIPSTVFFYFIATTLLSVIKQAIHQIWSLKKKDNGNNIMYYVKERLTGITMMFLVALLTVISYTMDMFEESFKRQELLSSLVGTVFSLTIITTWFTLLIKYLPEARVKWIVAIAGGLFTGILFNSGAFLVGRILIHKKVSLIFGVSSSIAMLLLFVFYCSFILYLGISFTYELAKAMRKPILPGKYSIGFTEEIREKGR